MGKKISIAYYLSANGGAEGDVELYTVDPAKRFVTKSVYVSFPPGTYFELEISILRGIKQVAPYKGTYRGDAQVIEDEFIEDIRPVTYPTHRGTLPIAKGSLVFREIN